MNNHKKVQIKIYISKRLLAQIEADIKGDSRSDKLTKCCEEGYKILNGAKNEDPTP